MIKRIITIGLLVIAALASPFALKANVLPKIKKSSKGSSNSHETTDCQAIIKHFENEYNIPENLLSAVAMVESGKYPWSINARGRAHVFRTKGEALSFIEKQKKRGTKNIYVGCMQICLKSHGKRFETLDHALTPYNNIRYAAKLLRGLFDRFGSWESALMHYNASSRKVSYKNRVLAIWGGDKADLVSTSFANKTKVSEDVAKVPHIKIAFGPGTGIRSHKDR